VIDPTGGAATTGQNDPTMVYDGGVGRPILSKTNAITLNNSSVTLVTAAVGVKTKVLQFRVSCTAFTAAGALYLLDGAAAGIAYMGQFGAVGAIGELSLAGIVVAQTPVNSALVVNWAGNGTLHYVLTYYQAP